MFSCAFKIIAFTKKYRSITIELDYLNLKKTSHYLACQDFRLVKWGSNHENFGHPCWKELNNLELAMDFDQVD